MAKAIFIMRARPKADDSAQVDRRQELSKLSLTLIGDPVDVFSC